MSKNQKNSNKLSIKKIIDDDNIEALKKIPRNDPCLTEPISLTFKTKSSKIRNPIPALYSVLAIKPKCLRYFISDDETLTSFNNPIFDARSRVNEKEQYLHHFAVEVGSLECLQIIDAAIRDANLLNIIDSDGTSPLHSAAQRNSLEMCKELVNSGADILFPDVNCETPYHISLSLSNLTIAKYFSDHLVEKVPSEFYKFLYSEYKNSKTLIEWYQGLQKNSVVEFLQTYFKKLQALFTVDNSAKPPDPSHCWIPCCNNTNRLHRCHICCQFFCPIQH